MGVEPDWPDLLREYEAALLVFERTTDALTTALVDRSLPAKDLSELFAAETSARDAVVLHRMRLLSACRDAKIDIQIVSPQNDTHI